jgi:hypothetical protein
VSAASDTVPSSQSDGRRTGGRRGTLPRRAVSAGCVVRAQQMDGAGLGRRLCGRALPGRSLAAGGR